MKPLQHLIFGVIFALILLLIFPQIGFFGFFVILVSSVLIDFDHYVYYVYKKKDFSLKNAYNWFVKNGEIYHSLPQSKKSHVKFGLFFLHGIETTLILSIFAFIFKSFFVFFIITGFVFHQFLDAIDLTKRNLPLLKVISVFYCFIYTKNKKLPEDII